MYLTAEAETRAGATCQASDAYSPGVSLLVQLQLGRSHLGVLGDRQQTCKHHLSGMRGLTRTLPEQGPLDLTTKLKRRLGGPKAGMMTF